MGIREKLNENPAITTGVTAAIIVIALIFILYQALHDNTPKPQTEAYYSIDDGKNYFADDINQVAPFMKDGKEAVRAYVFSCDGGKNKWVAYLERYSKESQKKILDARAKADDKQYDPMVMEEAAMNGLEIKKPGEGRWIRQNDPSQQRVQQILEIKCPDGTVDNLMPIYP